MDVDLWSLGCTLYYTACGESPFPNTDGEVYYQAVVKLQQYPGIFFFKIVFTTLLLGETQCFILDLRFCLKILNAFKFYHFINLRYKTLHRLVKFLNYRVTYSIVEREKKL